MVGVAAREGDKVCAIFATEGTTREHTDRASFAQCIFVDPAILHDHRKVLVGVFDELDILQWIAID